MNNRITCLLCLLLLSLPSASYALLPELVRKIPTTILRWRPVIARSMATLTPVERKTIEDCTEYLARAIHKQRLSFANEPLNCGGTGHWQRRFDELDVLTRRREELLKLLPKKLLPKKKKST